MLCGTDKTAQTMVSCARDGVLCACWSHQRGVVGACYIDIHAKSFHIEQYN
jgi:hypothetical protein